MTHPTRDERATVAAREIIDAEKKKHDAKTARLKAARLAKKAKGHKIVTAPEPDAPRGTVINLMDALRKSVKGDQAATRLSGRLIDFLGPSVQY